MLDVTHIEYTPETSPLLAGEHAIHGAVAADSVDQYVAGHYGHPVQEQRALADGKAVVDLSHYGIVTVTGPERLSWLHTLTTQQLQGMPAPLNSEALFLDLRGRIEIATKVHDDGETTYLITEPTMNASLLDWLTRMQFAARVELADRTGELALLGATDEVPGLDRPVWVDPWPGVSPGGFAYTEAPADHPAVHEDYACHLYILDAEQLVETVTALPEDFRVAGVMASEALRVAAGRPRQLFDTDERSIPHELDWIRTAVHLEKGCYKGQETVARVHNLGHPPRRLVGLLIDGSGHGLPEVGADIIVRPETDDEESMAAARSIGTLKSVAMHHEMGAIGTAIIRRNTKPEAELIIREMPPAGSADDEKPNFTAAAQETLTSPSAGKVVGRVQGLTNLRR
ncbi:MAG: folate-binding protein YgfZ [Micrococcaceae bacterium]|nr:folate-binding protein YgfZ [Micrococcaceae bacterium]